MSMADLYLRHYHNNAEIMVYVQGTTDVCIQSSTWWNVIMKILIITVGENWVKFHIIGATREKASFNAVL